MKEVEKKDVPEISGGQSSVSPLPYVPVPYPAEFPPNPGGPIGPGPTNPIDPLGDAINGTKL